MNYSESGKSEDITIKDIPLYFFQSSYGGYVYSYAVKSIVDLSKTEGAYLNALFWVSTVTSFYL